MPKQAIATDKQARLIELRSEGASYSQIAHELGVSTSTVANYCRRHFTRIAEAKNGILDGWQRRVAEHENRIAQLEKQLNL